MVKRKYRKRKQKRGAGLMGDLFKIQKEFKEFVAHKKREKRVDERKRAGGGLRRRKGGAFFLPFLAAATAPVAAAGIKKVLKL